MNWIGGNFQIAAMHAVISLSKMKCQTKYVKNTLGEAEKNPPLLERKDPPGTDKVGLSVILLFWKDCRDLDGFYFFFIGQDLRLDQHQKELISATGLTVLSLQNVVKSHSPFSCRFFYNFN